mgnify:CR=1 FL=1
MPEDRHRDDQSADTPNAREGAGADARESGSPESAGERRTREGAARDYQERMQDLDSAGAVGENHDREAGAEPRDRKGGCRPDHVGA